MDGGCTKITLAGNILLPVKHKDAFQDAPIQFDVIHCLRHLRM
jgi:hypothetical protein